MWTLGVETVTAQQAERLASRIVEMDRRVLVATLRNLDCGFDMDFSDKALAEMDLERLQHIVLAAALRAHGSAESDIQPPRRDDATFP